MPLETSQVHNAAAAKVSDLLGRLTLEEKAAQLVGLWAGARRGDNAAPLQDQLLADGVHVDEFGARGLGQLTRHWGTTPLGVPDGLAELQRRQEALGARTGIRAVVHEECLTGVLAWGATAYPTPLAWGATFEPRFAERLGRRIGSDLRALGVHQGLGPVLDVVRDARWGRVEECIGEDPLAVGIIGAAYVRGLEAEGRVATLKHFAGYSGSRAGRNHAPVPVGPRELADIYLPPFERAVRAGARSVMNSYADVDGVPAAASEFLLTTVLRDEWGFEGTVVADYFAIPFLERMHGVSSSDEESARLALTAGIDVELPTGSAYLEPLVTAVREGRVDEALVDRALERVLRQKAQLGLLGDGGGADREGDPEVDLDSPENRALAREVATASVVLLQNDGILPLNPECMPRLAVIGPNADRFGAMFGCYSYVKHVLPHHEGTPPLIQAPTVAEALQRVWPGPVATADGCAVVGEDRSGFAEALRLAGAADVAVVVLGDDSGMFGRGTSGEGCDREDLALPGVQADLLRAVVDAGTPVVLVLVTGRPYELGEEADRCAAVVQAFFPGQEGGPAIADILTGAAEPGGRLPVELPRPGAPQPSGYLRARLADRTDVSSADPTPRHPFGYGLSYTTYDYEPLAAAEERVPVDGWVELELAVRNTGDRAGVDVLQVYATDVVAQVVRPQQQLVAFRRVELAAGEEQTWAVRIPAGALAFTGIAGRRIVEPGRVVFTRAAHAQDHGDSVTVEITGSVTPLAEIAPEPQWRRVS